MEYIVKSGSPVTQETGCLVIGVYEAQKLTPAAEQIDDASDGALTRILANGDLAGKPRQTLLLHGLPKLPAERVLLIGCGRDRDLDDKRYLQIVTASSNALSETGAIEACSFLTELPVKNRDAVWKTRMLVQKTQEALYRFDPLKSKKEQPRHRLRKHHVMVANRDDIDASEQGLRIGLATSEGMKLAKDLGNLPGNICTPTYLAEQAEIVALAHENFSCTIIDEAEMEELGMGALLSVSKGSREPAKLIVMEYRGASEEHKPVVLVGKAVTFDSGGISIKPAKSMDEMKFDMCGGASVFGALHTCAQLELPLNVVGIVPATENLPGGEATKPGDVITSMSGQTIEVLNTDAEGRLILCDAITYAERYQPSVVIDIATLTGACIVALGKHPHGLFSNHSALAKDLLSAGISAADRAWKLPLWEDYQDQLKSNFADLANIGGPNAGAITAACFLSRFARKRHWAHLDIAGTAWLSDERKGATGRPVPLLVQYLMNRAGTAN